MALPLLPVLIGQLVAHGAAHLDLGNRRKGTLPHLRGAEPAADGGEIAKHQHIPPLVGGEVIDLQVKVDQSAMLCGKFLLLAGQCVGLLRHGGFLLPVLGGLPHSAFPRACDRSPMGELH